MKKKLMRRTVFCSAERRGRFTKHEPALRFFFGLILIIFLCCIIYITLPHTLKILHFFIDT